MLDKIYDTAVIESRIAKQWEVKEAFKAGAGASVDAESFVLMMPPPNVTGSLHIGHALTFTLQDILVRYHRMCGKNVLMQPGMDHAGIATQMVVEKSLAMRGEPSRQELGRKEFVSRVWQWREESGGAIVHQLKRLGVSCDWSRMRFTMDEGLSQAVLEVFVTLYKQGLIYKDKRLVNWDSKLQTVISDLEVEQKEVKGHLWHFRYPLAGKTFDPADESTFIIVATTRPETLLGDTALAVHPDDPRYKDKIGTYAILPLVGRKLPIVADTYADPEIGSGVVKITPAHDFNDFEVGRRHQLPAITVLDLMRRIRLRDNGNFFAGIDESDALSKLVQELDGLDSMAAREVIIARIEAEGHLAACIEHPHMVPHSERSGVVLEPLLTDQWYVNAAELAKPAMEAVRAGKTKFIPAQWEKTYFDWMENIQPWCISRQLWWGHQIPAWYGPDGKIFVEKTQEEACTAALTYYGKPVPLKRDEDVLDTWFSSALWPFSTLGWPEKAQELASYYPSHTLVTGFDILFFWVARMMMMGLHFMGDVPFRTVHLNALVRDKYGAKMSKSKGNTIDPLQLMDVYGVDALRFTIASMAAQGRDIKLDPERVAGYRNFATKLWNATRFAEMNGATHSVDFFPQTSCLTLNRWILTELAKTVSAVEKGIEQYKFSEAATALYRFVWNYFCDWYLELAKPIFQGEDIGAKQETQACVAWVLDTIYKLLHPFMPYITEELWAHTVGENNARSALLILTPWPKEDFNDPEAAAEINWLITLVTGIRSLRAEMNVPAGAYASLVIVEAGEITKARTERHLTAIKKLARVENVIYGETAPAACAQLLLDEANFCLPLGDLINFDTERARLNKDKTKIDQERAKINIKLNNPKFVENARPDVVAAERDRLIELEAAHEKIIRALDRIG